MSSSAIDIIKHEIQNIDSMEMKTTRNIKDVKKQLVSLDALIEQLENLVQLAKNTKQRQVGKITILLEHHSKQIREIENQFGIISNEQKHENTDKPHMEEIDIAGILINCNVYTTKELVPIMQYGIITLKENGKKIVVFRYGPTDFVSCSSINIYDYNTSNHLRTICCVNATKCTYGSNCKFYHDPLLAPYSNHIQSFIKSHIIPANPRFGHSSNFLTDLKNIQFDDLRTCARYCATMMLLIHKVSLANS